MRTVGLIVLLLPLAGCGSPDGAGDRTTGEVGDDGEVRGDLRLAGVASGFADPLLLTNAGDGSGRLFVVEKPGMVRVIGSNATFLDITDRVGSSGSEQGLLGIAFHPAFATNGVVVVSYTDAAGDTRLSRFALGSGGSLDPSSEELLLTVDQPFENHNGGHVAYGPDGFLYFGLGDGGLAGDPNLNGQNKGTLLGDILRLEVGPTGPYGIPQGNPYAGNPTQRPEIWSSGWRNPWRFSFDREGGDMWIGDVGQDMFEEIDHEPAGVGGRNYGWNAYEGNHHYPVDVSAPSVTASAGFTFPVAEYDHGDGCSVTGGHVYRGAAIPDLIGTYVFGDYCSGTVWGLRPDGDGWTMEVLLPETGRNISSFGEDESGELYLVDLQGSVSKFVA